jgi:ADP-ribosylation factor GTPase-activating protein 2/3
LYKIQTSESLYDQKPEEPAPALPTLTSTAAVTDKKGPSYPSRFEYIENTGSAETSSGGSQVIGHVAPPKSSNFFAEFGMDSSFKKSSSSSKVQVSSSKLLNLSFIV